MTVITMFVFVGDDYLSDVILPSQVNHPPGRVIIICVTTGVTPGVVWVSFTVNCPVGCPSGSRAALPSRFVS